MSDASSPIEIFVSYAPEDESLCLELEKHLSPLKRQGLITIWHQSQLVAGTDWKQVLDQRLERASVILLLLSVNFMASDYCYGIEMQRAMERHEANEARVIPILLRRIEGWQETPFGKLAALPSNKRPITSWRNRDKAFADVVKGIKNVLKEVEHLIANTPARALPPLWNIAYARNPLFTGQEQILTQPNNTFTRKQSTAPDVQHFYGRDKELKSLAQAVLYEKYHLVAILGIGGVGKTSLAAKLVHEVASGFECIFWRSLQHEPELMHILKQCLLYVSNHQETTIPGNEDDTISLLIEYLRKHRCLLVLDNFESVLESDVSERLRIGQYKKGYEGYGKLLLRIGESNHQSCLLLTSREKPKEIVHQEDTPFLARSLLLSGVEDQEARKILEPKRLIGTDKEWSSLNRLYSGNPLALLLIAEPIREVFERSIGKFISQEEAVFGDIYHLLNHQIQRLSYWEREILYWLALEQIPVSLQQLRNNIVRPSPSGTIPQALASLKRRSLILTGGSELFTLHPVVKEYVTIEFVKQVFAEIKEGPKLFEADPLLDRYPLMKAQALDHVRNTQSRIIVEPLAMRLRSSFGEKESREKLKTIIRHLQQPGQRTSGYAAGNVLNLLIHLRANLRGYDFSRLTVRQAYLRGVSLPEVNFSDADLATAVFTETFGSILSVAIDVNGQLLAAGTVTGEIKTWRLADRAPALILHWHTNWVWSVAFSPDGRLIASGSDDRTVRLWDVSTGQCLVKLDQHTDRVRAVVFSPDGRYLASGSEDGQVLVWDVNTYQCYRKLDRQGEHIYALAFHPQRPLLASGSEDGQIRLWNIETCRYDSLLEGHRRQVYALAFHPQRPLLASGSEDGQILLWNIETGQCDVLERHRRQVYALAFHPQRPLLASGNEDGAVDLWDLEKRQRQNTLKEHTGRVQSVVFSPDGKQFASGSNDQTVKIWDIETEQCVDTLQGYTNLIWSVEFSPDGKLLASGSNDKRVRLWDRETGHYKTLEGHEDRVRAVAFKPPAGKILASGSEDKVVRLWSVMTGRCLMILEGHADRVRAVAFKPPTGEILASGGEDGLVIVWDVRNGQRIATLETDEKQQVYALAFNPDGSVLASGCEDGLVRLWRWDGQEYQKLAPLKGHTDKIYALAFSPDGEMLASGSNDQTVKLWHIKTGKEAYLLQGHTNRIFSLAFSQDGKVLASGSNDQTVMLWDTCSGEHVDTLQEHNTWIYSIALHPNGQILASGGDKGTIKLWDIGGKEKRPLKPLQSEKPYEKMDITGARGLRPSQRAMLIALGAIDNEPPV